MAPAVILPYSSARKDGRRDLRRPRLRAAALQPGFALDAPPAARPIADARLADRRHGHRQRDAGLLFRRRRLRDAQMRPPRMASGSSPRARRSSTSAASRLGPAPTAVAADEEMSRVVPVDRGAARPRRQPISIDTSKARVAAAALEAGASIVNDVWGFQRDPEMARVVADERRGGGADAQSRRASIPRWTSSPTSSRFLSRSIDIALAAGVAEERLMRRSGLRLRQDAGAKSSIDSPAAASWRRSAVRCCSAFRASRPSGS